MHTICTRIEKELEIIRALSHGRRLARTESGLMTIFVRKSLLISVLLFTTAIAIRNPIRIHQNMNLFFFNRIVIFLAQEKTSMDRFLPENPGSGSAIKIGSRLIRIGF